MQNMELIRGMEQEPLDARQAVEEYLVNSNPEALLDVLTIRSLRERYSDTDNLSVTSESLLSSDGDLDSFVREFTIDDSISECFAVSPSLNKTGGTKTKHHKKNTATGSGSKSLKKTHHRSSSSDVSLQNISSETISPKRSRKITGLFGRRTKSKSDLRKQHADEAWSTNSEDHSYSLNGVMSPDFISGETSRGHYETMAPAINNQKRCLTSVKRNDARFNETEHLQALFGEMDSLSKANTSEDSVPYAPVTQCEIRANVTSDSSIDDRFGKLLRAIEEDDIENLIHDLGILPQEIASNLRDRDGNTILHRCIAENNVDAVRTILALQPGLTSQPNADNMTPLQVAIKFGREDCLEILLNKFCVRHEELSTGRLPQLLNTAAQFGQERCLSLLLKYSESNMMDSLPRDVRGRTAAHLAAERGHVTCLQCLVEGGYDVLLSNHASDQPLKVAENNEQHSCFRYLLLLQLVEVIFFEAVKLNKEISRINNQRTKLEGSLKQLHTQLDGLAQAFKKSQEKQRVQKQTVLRQCRSLLGDMSNQMTLNEAGDIQGGILCQLKDLAQLVNTFEEDESSPSNVDVNGMTSYVAECLKSVRETDDTQKKDRPRDVDLSDTHFRSMVREIHQEWGQPKCDVLQSVRKFMRKYTQENTYESSPNWDTPFTVEGAVNYATSGNGDNREKCEIDTDRLSPSFIQKSEKDRNVSVNPDTNEICLSPEDLSDIQKDASEYCDNSSHRLICSDPSHAYSGDLEDDSSSTITSQTTTVRSVILRMPGGQISEEAIPENFGEGNSEAPVTWQNGPELDNLSAYERSLFSAENSSDWWSTTRSTSGESDQSYSEESSCYSDDEGIFNFVRLNLENEDLPDKELRSQRLEKHLDSLHRLHVEPSTLVETVVNATGERISRPRFNGVSPHINTTGDFLEGQDESEMSDIQPQAKDKKKARVKLFNHRELVEKREMTQSEFLECYDRSHDVILSRRCHDELDLPWEQLQFSDTEESHTVEKPWYELSDDEESLARGWASDSEASTLCESSTD